MFRDLLRLTYDRIIEKYVIIAMHGKIYDHWTLQKSTPE